MRFPRSIKPFRGQLEIAPFISVAFLISILLMFGSSLVFTPGIPVHLPETAELPGASNPTITVAVDAGGHLYYENQITDEAHLREKLVAAVDQSKEPVTLVLQMDEQAAHGVSVRLGLLAREAGIKDLLYGTRQQTAPTPIQAPP
jgi:biopolymer transport protein ExbD